MTNSSSEDMTFETAYREIVEIVDQLESGKLPLAESLDLYQRGRLLLQYCEQQLENAELRVTQLGDED